MTKPIKERHTEISEEDYENYVNSYDESTRYYKFEEDYNLTDEQVAPI